MPGRWETFAVSLAILLAVVPAGCAPARWAADGPGEAQTYRVRGSSTLLDVAEHFRLGYLEIVAANPGVDPWMPGADTEIILPVRHLPPSAPREGVVINLADLRLYHYSGGQLLGSYALGIGRDGLSTPVGNTTIVRKLEDPVWRPTLRMRREDPSLPAEVGPGRDNPMGTRALYLGWRPYAIHGTNKPFGVGRRVSSGCLRMYNEDIEALYDRVEVGTQVAVVDEPINLEWIDGELYMEAHPTQRQSAELEVRQPVGDRPVEAQPLEGQPVEGSFDEITKQIEAVAAGQAERLDWDLIRKLAEDRRGYATRITRTVPIATVNLTAPVQ